MKNPTQFLAEHRRRLGDTFVAYLFGVRFLFTFSSTGLKSLYSIKEADASFTEATKGLLGLKLPQEVPVQAKSNNKAPSRLCFFFESHHFSKFKLISCMLAHMYADCRC